MMEYNGDVRLTMRYGRSKACQCEKSEGLSLHVAKGGEGGRNWERVIGLSERLSVSKERTVLVDK